MSNMWRERQSKKQPKRDRVRESEREIELDRERASEKGKGRDFKQTDRPDF